jgi:hypothetical protein
MIYFLFAAALCMDMRDRRLAVFGDPASLQSLLLACPSIGDCGSGEGTFHGVEDRAGAAVRQALLHHGNAILICY